MEVRLGTKFQYLDRVWKITGFSKDKVFFQSTDGVKSQMDLDVFVREAKVFPPVE